MHIPDTIGKPLCTPCIDLLIQDEGLGNWLTCHCCWKWFYQHYEWSYTQEFHQPLCIPCFFEFHNGKERLPNARKRLELWLRRLLKHAIPLPDECVRRIAEFARPGWLP